MNSNDDMIEILDDISTNENPTFGSNEGVNIGDTNSQSFNSINEPIQGVSEINYDPVEPKKEEITINDESTDIESKSGLTFVIVLFVLLAVFIIALPYISKFFR